MSAPNWPPRGPPRPARGSLGPAPLRPKPVVNPLRRVPRPEARNPPTGAAKPVAPPSQQRPLAKAPPNFEAIRQQHGGWSTPPPAIYSDFPLMLTKRNIKDGVEHHVMKIAPPSRRANQVVDPTDPNDFTHPVTLHRRDPRQPRPGHGNGQDVPEAKSEQTEEAEKLAKIKAARDAQRAADDALKAPTSKDGKKSKDKKFKVQISYQARSEQAKKDNQTKYDEALPWHLEDADGKNSWVGQYEEPLSSQKVAFMIAGGGFRMIPIDKWYKFTPKRPAVTAMTLEEAEKAMSKPVPLQRWDRRDQLRKMQEKEMEESRALAGRGMVLGESATFRNASRREKQDIDTIDMSGDEFQDDDDQIGFEPDRDEEQKEARERIRREQLSANLFGEADEAAVDAEIALEEKEAEERKILGKGILKVLKKRDKAHQYDTDDSERERNPFLSSSESDTDSDDDLFGKEDDKDTKEAKDKAGTSATPSKDENAPQGKKAAAEAPKKGKSLKRAGSPMGSESSENESTRLYKKKKTGPSMASGAGSRSTSPVSGSQPRRTGVGLGSASDAEATGGDMSDGAGGKKKKKKKHQGRPPHGKAGPVAKGSPSPSRAGSPTPSSAMKGGVSPPTAALAGIVTAEEILKHVPPRPGGIKIGKLLKIFTENGRIGPNPGQTTREKWIETLKSSTSFEDKLIKRKET